MAESTNIRVRPALFKPADQRDAIGVVRFTDPDNGAEFFLIEAVHAEALIESIRTSADFARQSAEAVQGFGADELRLMIGATGAQV